VAEFQKSRYHAIHEINLITYIERSE